MLGALIVIVGSFAIPTLTHEEITSDFVDGLGSIISGDIHE